MGVSHTFELDRNLRTRTIIATDVGHGVFRLDFQEVDLLVQRQALLQMCLADADGAHAISDACGSADFNHDFFRRLLEHLHDLKVAAEIDRAGEVAAV
ncbi:hypothetical protein D3C78_1269510 [compost metagenome]